MRQRWPAGLRSPGPRWKNRGGVPRLARLRGRGQILDDAADYPHLGPAAAIPSWSACGAAPTAAYPSPPWSATSPEALDAVLPALPRCPARGRKRQSLLKPNRHDRVMSPTILSVRIRAPPLVGPRRRMLSAFGVHVAASLAPCRERRARREHSHQGALPKPGNKPPP